MSKSSSLSFSIFKSKKSDNLTVWIVSSKEIFLKELFSPSFLEQKGKFKYVYFNLLSLVLSKIIPYRLSHVRAIFVSYRLL